MRIYMVDVGVLLDKEHKEFENYNTVYDKKYGYYDENQFYVKNEEDAIDFVKAYVLGGVEKTYGIVCITEMDDDIVENKDGKYGKLEEIPVEYEAYYLDSVSYSVAKLDGDMVEHFLDYQHMGYPSPFVINEREKDER